MKMILKSGDIIEGYKILFPLKESKHTCLAIHKDTTNMVVMKQIKAKEFDKEKTDTLMSIQHCNILSPLQIIEDKIHVYIVYKYYESDLRIYCSTGKLKEAEVMKQLIKGYEELYKHNVLHLNIKPESLFFDPETNLVKIGNFWLRKDKQSNSYSAPEVCTKVNYKADIWSIGALFYFILHGEDPYKDNVLSIGKCVIKEQVQIPYIDFICSCLQYDPDMRPTCEQVAKCSFLQNVDEAMRYEHYICACKEDRAVFLNCRHSFCVYCIAKIQRNILLNIISKSEAKCPKCLSELSICKSK